MILACTYHRMLYHRFYINSKYSNKPPNSQAYWALQQLWDIFSLPVGQRWQKLPWKNIFIAQKTQDCQLARGEKNFPQVNSKTSFLYNLWNRSHGRIFNWEHYDCQRFLSECGVFSTPIICNNCFWQKDWILIKGQRKISKQWRPKIPNVANRKKTKANKSDDISNKRQWFWSGRRHSACLCSFGHFEGVEGLRLGWRPLREHSFQVFLSFCPFVILPFFVFLSFCHLAFFLSFCLSVAGLHLGWRPLREHSFQASGIFLDTQVSLAVRLKCRKMYMKA